MVCVAFCKKYDLSFRLLASSAGLVSRNRHFTITQTTEEILRNLELWKESDEKEHGYFNSIQILDDNGAIDLEFNNSINSEVPMAWVVKEKLLSTHLGKLLKKEEHCFSALRILKKRMQTEGIFNELRAKTYFTAKSEKRRLAKAAGRRRWLKKIEKQKQEE